MAQVYNSGALDEPRLRELIEVGRTLVAELDPEAVFRQLLEVACELTGARYAALGVLDEDRHELERFITHGIDEAGRRAIGNLPRGRGVLGLLIEQPRPLRLADVGAHPRSYGFPPGHPPMSNFLGVPVMIRGHAWGNLYLTEKQSGEFDRADEQSAVILAEWAAIAVENARLYSSVERRNEEMERAVHRLEATTEIAHAVGGETDLGRILEIVVKRGRALVEARTLLILLRERDELIPASIAGERGDGMAENRIPTRGSIPGQVLEAREPRRVHDLDPSLMARPGRSEEGVTALLVPLVFRGHALGVLVALDPLGRDLGFSNEDQQVLVSFAASAAIAVATAQSVAEGRTRESIAATERERGRWARELHDESLQSLAGLRVLLSTARRSDPDETERLLSQGIEQVDDAIAEMRRLIADLRPPTLDELGLGAALEALGERTTASGAIEVDLVLDLDFHSGRTKVRLAREIEDAAYRLVQEALNNAARHGSTDKAKVEAIESGDKLRLRVSDQGRGFDPSERSDGFGLVGMRERVTLAGGTLELRSSPGEGTTIVAVLPARQRTEQEAGQVSARSLPRAAEQPTAESG
ncbi:MAG TPA: GAF domain-containing sensor histidine kinase [Solirubrobacterales bacterium]|jgi:signal transduction histidine kinase|nr:GAF domain-containing sensor histidine kinase [Solirubrobacterales bacterium]